MSKAESSSSDSSSDASDTDSSSDISSSDSDRESNSLDDPRDRRSHRRSSTPPYRRDPPVADKMTVGSRHYRPVTVGSRHAADGMIAGPHRHLTLAETTVHATMIEVVTAVIVAIHPRRAVLLA